MIIDIKYHIASLAAVFLALAVGIAIGTTMLGNDVVSGQQQEIVKVIKQDFEKLRKENTALEQKVVVLENERNSNEQFAKMVIPQLVEGRLFEKNIGIIETGENFFTKESLNTLTAAGGNICSVTSIGEDFVLNAPASSAQITEILKAGDIDKKDLPEIMLKTMVADIVEGHGADTLHRFEELGLVHLSGDYTQPLDAVIVLAGSNKDDGARVKDMLMPLIQQLKTYDIRLAGTEFTNVKYSDMKYFRKSDISTVDNVDNTVGQFTLVLVLEGTNGNFGTKKTAEALMPEIK